MKKGMKKVLLVVATLLLFAQQILHAQVPDIRSSIDKKDIVIGDAIKLQLMATYNPQLSIVQFPVLPDTFNGFEVISKSKIDTTFNREVNRYKQEIIITHFDSGRWMIPKFKFDVQSKQGLPASNVLSDSLWVNVNTVAVDTSKPFMPIADVRGATKPWQDIALEIGVVVVLLVILVVGIWYARKKYLENKKTKALIPVLPPIPPYEKAIKAFTLIEQEALYEKGEDKLYYTQLTDVLRTYLEGQFGMDCFEKTSSEIMQVVKTQKALSSSRQGLRFVLETADIVKFAKGKPSSEEHMQCLELAKAVVKESYKKFQNQQKGMAS
jgi:hypothetical protein